MTPVALIDALADECKEFFGASVRVFTQELPAPTLEDAGNFPFILVQLDRAKQADAESQLVCPVVFLSGVYDDTPDFQGWRDAFSLLERLSAHLYGKKIIARKYEVDLPVEMIPGDEGDYPYYFAALKCNFSAPRLVETALRDLI